MKSLTNLLHVVLAECGDRCGIGTTRDFQTITRRVENEGLAFITITLADFGKDLEKGLDQGFADHSMFLSFKKRGELPVLFGGFLDLVFNRASGRLLDTPSIEAIRCLRQLSLMWAKIELECTQERNQAAIDKYVQCEQEVRQSDKALLASEEAMRDFCRIGGMLLNDVFSLVDRKIWEGDIMPKHGPGATAERITSNGKYYSRMWTTRLESIFPSGEYLFPSWNSVMEEQESLELLEPGAEIPVRVITVPKTQKTPRIIAIEPTPMQYMQQGILEALEEGFAGDDILANLIEYSSQLPNQELARIGSLSGHLATLDLSEASDRVSYQHVRLLLRNFPHLRDGVDACRSRKADVPGHGVKRLAKFASMGSALCFPFEAMVFATVIFKAIERALNRPLTKRLIKSFLGQVRIYGDDIIVPVEFVPFVVQELEAFGFKVNAKKSFWTGKFRESCGADYYDGEDVSVIRLRDFIPTQRQQVDELESIVSFRNRMYLAGYWKTVRYLDAIIEKVIPFPAVAPTSPALGKTSVLGYENHKEHPHLQRPLVKAAVVENTYRRDPLDGYGALMKHFLKRSELPFADRKHLQFAGRPVSRDIKVRWAPSY
ncbi:TPA_asm: RNA-directed RNA polymerase [ssRNA phage Gephyllon.1_19]|uniref:RNA-directed RNA polymerase n=2 Tax=Leviviricetes TaxID=2842243 RepID=A0A8S5KZ43_9VIRU|nr:RNA-directed RNA polymerase [ssRNA phage Gephyllon.1_19]QDH90281.1 MAG: RNA-dependent RNA polymerase [Leviviridae sp.]DAD50467.1 TPA_asm: RNA-directed RNA polymerase [ssRNA phage Gephyllon.1_19]